MKKWVLGFAAATGILLSGCITGNSPASGNFTVKTHETVFFQGAMGGSYTTYFSASFGGTVITGSYPPDHRGYVGVFNGISNRDGVYNVQDAIVPARWHMFWSSGPCYGSSADSASQIQYLETWIFECTHVVQVIGLQTIDQEGNVIDHGCCAIDTLTDGMSLSEGEGLTSSDQRFRLIYQGDGNLVLYNAYSSPMWASNTFGNAGSADMQGDGNFVIYNSGRSPVWSTGTVGHPGARLIVQNDGNVVVYDPYNNVLWATNTCCQ